MRRREVREEKLIVLCFAVCLCSFTHLLTDSLTHLQESPRINNA